MLRLLDFGRVTGLRSQTWWHAIAESMRPGDPPVLALMTPGDPYVSIGFHRRADELDLAACARRGLAIYRRRAGGGPVLCDDGQLFFQLIVPSAALPAVRDRAWERALGPAVDAFRSLGVPAALAEGNDLVAAGRKVSGTGAAQIGDATVFVGNMIFVFDHTAMADVLALPRGAKEEAARLMRRHLGSVRELTGRVVSAEEAVAALLASYGDAFGGIMPASATDAEEAAAAELDARFSDPAWVFAERSPQAPRVKIRAGVSLLVLGSSWISVDGGRIERAGFDAGWIAAPGAARELERALRGVAVDESALTGAIKDFDARVRSDDLVGAIVDAYSRGA